MGQITDSLRASLRDLAQSDARLYRGLQQELADPGSRPSQPAPQLRGDARATQEELEGLSIKVLWGLCKARGIKGLSSGPKSQQILALLSHPDGAPLRSALPGKATKTERPRVQASARTKPLELQALEQRLDRLERLVLLIAQEVGIAQDVIDQVHLPPA